MRKLLVMLALAGCSADVEGSGSYNVDDGAALAGEDGGRGTATARPGSGKPPPGRSDGGVELDDDGGTWLDDAGAPEDGGLPPASTAPFEGRWQVYATQVSADGKCASVVTPADFVVWTVTADGPGRVRAEISDGEFSLLTGFVTESPGQLSFQLDAGRIDKKAIVFGTIHDNGIDTSLDGTYTLTLTDDIGNVTCRVRRDLTGSKVL